METDESKQQSGEQHELAEATQTKAKGMHIYKFTDVQIATILEHWQIMVKCHYITKKVVLCGGVCLFCVCFVLFLLTRLEYKAISFKLLSFS